MGSPAAVVLRLEGLHPERVGQVHLRPGGLQHIGGPVPPIRRFQDNTRARPRRGDRLAQLRRAVVIRAVPSRRPSSVIRTRTLRRRCKSIPTT